MIRYSAVQLPRSAGAGPCPEHLARAHPDLQEPSDAVSRAPLAQPDDPGFSGCVEG
jgi:hypothetical protein